MLSTFFRSATHATDSTFSGCTANNAATSRLGPTRFVTHASSRNSTTAFSACSNTLSKWWPIGFSANSW